MGTFLPERIWAVDQKQPRFFDPGRWHKQRRCDDCTGHLWKTDDHMRICPLSLPPDPGRRDQLGMVSTVPRLGPWCRPRLLLLPSSFFLIISFIPSAPRWLYFTAHRLQCQDSHSHDQEINVWAPTLPFFPFLFDVKGKAMFQIFATCFGRLCRVVTFGPVTMPQPRWCLTPTFLSGGRRKKTVVVLYFPSLDEGNAGGETLELGRRLERNLSERL